MARNALSAVLLLALAAACSKPKSEEAPPSSDPAKSAPPAATAPATVAAPAPTVAPAGNMAHCPSSVAGAVTKIDDAAGGVAITITSSDAAASKEIRARAAFLAQSAKSDAQSVTHNGSGNGGGVYGRCPVVMRDTALAVTDVDGGSKIVVTPRDAKEKDWLGRESRARLAEMEMPGSNGAGAGKMAHCPNAVKGATTSISDGAGAVKITVTSKDESVAKEIRERATKIVAAAKATDKGAMKHDGNGDGGGGFGRCPIVLKDTSVEEKDAPGGAVFTVKPKDAKNLAALKKAVEERSAKFEVATR